MGGMLVGLIAGLEGGLEPHFVLTSRCGGVVVSKNRLWVLVRSCFFKDV